MDIYFIEINNVRIGDGWWYDGDGDIIFFSLLNLSMACHYVLEQSEFSQNF